MSGILVSFSFLKYCLWTMILAGPAKKDRTARRWMICKLLRPLGHSGESGVLTGVGVGSLPALFGDLEIILGRQQIA